MIHYYTLADGFPADHPIRNVKDKGCVCWTHAHQKQILGCMCGEIERRLRSIQKGEQIDNAARE